METSFTNEELASYVQAARELMNDEGRHWVQGHFVVPVHEALGEFAYCSYGALRRATEEYSGQASYNVLSALCLALAEDEEIGATHLDADLEEARDEGANAYSRVVRFNDAEGRKWEEVEAAFKRTEERLRGVPA